MNKAPVSVIIPCYNCANTVERAIQSCANQSLLPAEVILIDDASDDDGKTCEKLKALSKQYTDKFHTRVIALDKNSGAGAARNAGWVVATQKFIAFLDSDDAWHPQKLEIQSKFMADNPQIAISGHRHFVMKDAWPSLVGGHKEIKPWRALLSNPFATPSVMLRSNVGQRFCDDKRTSEDYLLWLQIILHGGGAAKLDAPLAASFKADYGEGGLSAQLWKMERGELDTYARLYDEKLIGLLPRLFFSGLSLLKFLKRILVCFLS